MPAYRDYRIRAQVSEGLNLAAAAKTAVAETYRASSQAPASRTSAGMTANATDSQGRYVQSIDVINGEIIIRFRQDADGVIAGQAVHLVPYLGSDATGTGIVWVCGRATPPAGLEPLGGATPGGTTIPPQYLPSGCR
jgi:type IV pilus assembly protein PilA